MYSTVEEQESETTPLTAASRGERKELAPQYQISVEEYKNDADVELELKNPSSDEDVDEFNIAAMDDDAHESNIVGMLREFRAVKRTKSAHVGSSRPLTDPMAVWNSWRDYANLEILDIFKKIIIPVFLILLVAELFFVIAYGLHLYDVMPNFTQFIGFLLLLICTLFASAMGAIGVYTVSSISDAIDAMKNENNAFEMSTYNLRSSRSALAGVVKEMQARTKQLAKNAAELNHVLDSFEGLRLSLQDRVGEHETIEQFVNELNTQCADMKDAMVQSEQAHLISIFYDVQFMHIHGGDHEKEKEEGLSRDQYEMFLARLSRKTRAKFEVRGFAGLDSDSDGNVAVAELFRQVTGVLRSATPQPNSPQPPQADQTA